MADYGASDVSTTSLGVNQFPISEVYVPNGTLTALEGGPSSTDLGGKKSAPASMYVKDGGDVAQGQTTDAANANTVVGQLKQIKTNTASVVIGSGTLTANIGTTGGLALDTSINGVIVAQGSTTSGQKGALTQGAVTSSAPTYTTGQTSPLSLTTAGALRVDNSASTQPVSGTFWQATQPVSAASLPLPTGAATSAKQPALGTAGTASADVITVQGVTSMTPLKVDGSAVTQPVSGTFWQATQPVSGTTTANAGSGTFTNQQSNITTDYDTGAGTQTMTMFGVALPASGGSVAGGTATNPLRTDPTGTTTQPVSGTFWQVTQPVSGTITANAGTGPFPVAGIVASGASNANNPVKVGGAFNTTQPTVTTGQVVDAQYSARGAAIVATGTDTFNVTVNAALPTGSNVIGHVIADSGSTTAVTQTTASNLNAQVQGAAASGAAQAGNPVKVGGVFNTTQPTVTTGQAVDAQMTARGAQIVATGTDTFNVTVNAALPTGGNTIGAVTQASGPWTSNVTQINSSAIVTSATGVQKVGVVGNAGATVDSTVAAGTAPTNALVTGAVYNSSAPAPTSGQTMALQADQAGNMRLFPGMALATLSAWNSSTGLNATQNIFTNSGAESVLVQLTQTTTITAGAITYEVSYDGANWLTIPASAVLDPTSSTFAQISLPYTLQASTNKSFILTGGGWQGLRIKLSTQITGTGTVTPNYALLPYGPADTVIALSPTAANFNVTASAGTNLNTSALALESGGNLAKLPLAQGSTTSGQSGPLTQGAVTTGFPAYTTAQTSPFSLNTFGQLRVDPTSAKATYTYAISATAPYASPTDWIVIRGSSTKTVKIMRIEISGAATAATEVIFTLKKHTIANTGGTSTTPTFVKHDSNDGAATATVLLYSVAPTIDASATIFRAVRMTLALAPAATSVNPDRYVEDFGSNFYEPLVLRGVAQEFAINFAGAAVPSGGVYDVAIVISEE